MFSKRSFKEDKLKESLSGVIMELAPQANEMPVKDEVKHQLLGLDNLSVEKYIPRQIAVQVMQQKQIKPNLKYVTWYPKAAKFIVSQQNHKRIKDKCSLFIQGNDLVIYDQIQRIITEVKELKRIGNIDRDIVDLRGLGIQTRNMDEINLIPFQQRK